MDDIDPREITKLKRRRGVVRASITRIRTKTRELEGTESPNQGDAAKHIAEKLDSLDTDFRRLHLELVDLLDDDELLSNEQDILDEVDDNIIDLKMRLLPIMKLTTNLKSERGLVSRKLAHFHGALRSIDEAISSLDSPDKHVLIQHKEQLIDTKRNLRGIHDNLMALDLAEEDELLRMHSDLERLHFDCSVKLKMLVSESVSDIDSTESKGIRLPKLDVPVFDGNILNWRRFWEKFSVSIHERSSLADSEKLVYLQHALKDGSAKGVIEGLSQSGENYAEAVDCLRSRYNRPRLIHQTHVKMIFEAPALKEGTGKELRKLHDTV
ncbi:uncharacterized protein LOC135344358 [Halichondria panicea]|uniref:uncharacterized protein LOC135344358 n=1 Tax=Halichondria panicea TaxID=6063 RepID=UPI00312B8263